MESRYFANYVSKPGKLPVVRVFLNIVEANIPSHQYQWLMGTDELDLSLIVGVGIFRSVDIMKFDMLLAEQCDWGYR